MDEELPDRCRVDAWKPAVAGVAEVFHARMVDYGYPRHSHDTWTVLIVDTGAISYELDRRDCDAVGQTVAILPPGVTHNGRPAPGALGFSKRVLYLEQSLLPLDLIGAAVDQTTLTDPELRAALVAIHRQLAPGGDRAHAESLLVMIVDRLHRHLSPRSGEVEGDEPTMAARLRELLDASALDDYSLDEASHELGRSKAHLIRSFGAAYGLAPHAYRIGRRVDAARKLLLDGVSPAETAVTVGFYDQSHLTRHFKRHLSVPPATYAAGHRTPT